MPRRTLGLTALLVGLISSPSAHSDEPPAADTDVVEPKLTARSDRLFVSHANGTILMLNARTLQPVRSWKGDGLDAFAASANGEQMATDYKNEVSCGATDQPKPTWTVKVAGDPKVDSIHFVSPEMLAVVVGIDQGKGSEGRVVVLSTKTGEVKRTIQFKNNYVTSAAGAEGWDRLAATYASPEDEDRIILLDLGTGKPIWDQKTINGTWLGGLNAKRTRVTACAAAADYEVHAIDLSTGKLSGRAHVGEQFVGSPEFAAGGKYIVVTGKLKTLMVVNADDMKLVGERTLPGFQSFTVSPDGDWLYLAAGAGGNAENPATITRVSMTEFVRGLKKPK